MVETTPCMLNEPEVLMLLVVQGAGGGSESGGSVGCQNKHGGT